jgi:hypothetical protein
VTSRSRLREAMAPGENGRPPILSPNMIKASLGNVGCSAATRFLESLGTTTPGDRLDSVTNPDIRKLFEQDLAIYRHIFGRIGINMPTPAELEQANIDLGRLAGLKETRPNHALVVAPLAMSLEKTRDLISAVSYDPSLQDIRINSDGLSINHAIAKNWDQIIGNTVANWRMPATNDDNKWTAFLMPCGDEPEHLNISYAEMKRQNKTTTPLIGYIAYQMHRIYQNKQPIDSETQSLAAGEFINMVNVMRVVPTVCWSTSHKSLEIGWASPNTTISSIGIRPPIR